MAGITVDGFVPKTFDEIVEEINRSMKEAFGETFDTSPESPDGQIISIVASALEEQWQMAEASYNAFNPAKAFGLGLDNLIQLNGIHRLEGDVSKAMVTFFGVDGTIIPAGTVVSNTSGDLFATAQTTVLPSTNIPVESVEFGLYDVTAGSINVLVTTIVGLQGVVNDIDGFNEYEEESDEDLRTRRASASVSSGTSTINAIYSAFARIGVKDVYVEENITGAPLPSGQPDNTVRVIADKATVEDVAQIVFDNKTTGIRSFGGLSHIVTDDGGHPHTVYFDRPTYKDVFFDIDIQITSQAKPTYEQDIKDLLLNHVDAISIGRDMLWSDAILRMAEIDGIVIKKFHIGLSDIATSQDDILNSAEEKVITSQANISVELV